MKSIIWVIPKRLMYVFLFRRGARMSGKIEYPQIVNIELPRNYKYRLKDVKGRLELVIIDGRGNKLIITNLGIVMERPTRTLKYLAEQFRLPTTITLGYFVKR